MSNDIGGWRTDGRVLAVPRWRQATAVAFYNHVFGATVLRRLTDPESGVATGVDLQVGALRIAIRAGDQGRAIAAPGRGAAICELPVDDVDAVLARAVAIGGAVRSPDADAAWNRRVAMLADPFGHVWALSAVRRRRDSGTAAIAA